MTDYDRMDDEALEVVASAGRTRFHDYHPWEPPPGRVSLSGGSLREALAYTATWLASVCLVLALVGKAADAAGASVVVAVLWGVAATVVGAVSLRALR